MHMYCTDELQYTRCPMQATDLDALLQPGVLCALCVVQSLGGPAQEEGVDGRDNGLRKLQLHAPPDSELRAALEQGQPCMCTCQVVHV